MERLIDSRKRDAEDSQDNLKAMLKSSRVDFEKDVNHILDQIEDFRKDLQQKCHVNELLEAKAKLQSAIQMKCDLKEVQVTLNDCQQDIV